MEVRYGSDGGDTGDGGDSDGGNRDDRENVVWMMVVI